jgi:hypothetical protein
MERAIMLSEYKVTNIFFSINRFYQLFSLITKEKSITDSKVHHNKLCRLLESRRNTCGHLCF